MHVDEEVADPAVLGRLWVGAAEQNAPVCAMRIGGPQFLTVNDEVVAVFDPSRRERGYVRAGVGFGIALAPDLLGRKNPRHVAFFLLSRAPPNERGSDHPDPDGIDELGFAGARQLAVVKELLRQGGAASAVALQ